MFGDVKVSLYGVLSKVNVWRHKGKPVWSVE